VFPARWAIFPATDAPKDDRALGLSVTDVTGLTSGSETGSGLLSHVMTVIDFGGTVVAGVDLRATVALPGATDRSPLEQRILDATMVCVARWGVAKTTLDDIAREAACSRATVYRVFPGGKDAVLESAFTHDLYRVLLDVCSAVAPIDSLEETLAVALSSGVAAIRGHDALAYLMQHEPGVVLPWISFHGLDPLLAFVTKMIAPMLARYVPDPPIARADQPSVGPTSARHSSAGEMAEVIGRLVVSYAFEPTEDAELDLADPDAARRFVRTFVVPGLAARVALPAGSVAPEGHAAHTVRPTDL